MGSSVECDERVIDVVADALQRPLEEREQFIQQACNGDAALVCAVNDALAWEANNASFLNAPWMEFTRLVSPFASGEIVNDRFEIVREIGEGGMGMVYEAFDRRLQHRVAIKAAKPGFQRLLSPELKSALKVSHHNICRDNEIHTAKTEWGEIDFLTMEFLEGETLSVHLKETGKLSHDEALDVACQLCAGLMEAHQSGIIHRDLKSGNVILCQNEDGSRRAVITDFGLAGPSSSSGEMAGTPAYMAPELWRGESASKLSDIYALGVILYEMVAGRKPYRREDDAGLGRQETVTPAGETVAEVADGHASLINVTQQEREQPAQTRPPSPPSTWMKGLDPRWNRVIMGCLELDPADRTQDVGDVLTELRHEKIRKWPFVTAAVVVLVLAAAIGLIRPLRQWIRDMIWPPSVRLVVLPPAGDDSGSVLSGGALQDVSRRLSNLRSGARSVAVISPADAKDLGVKTPEQARKTLHATHALETSAAKQGDATVVEGSVIELETQTHVRDFSFRYAPDTVGALPGALAGEVSSGLGLEGGPAGEALSPAATGAYDRGLDLFQKLQHTEEAIRLFQQATQLDPRSTLPLTALVEAEAQRFDETKDAAYLESAQQYLQNAQNLNPDSVSVHLAAGRLYQTTGKLEKALDEYLRVRSVAPANIKAARRAAWIYDRLDMPDKAIAEYRRAIALDPAFFETYGYFGGFYYHRGNYSAAAEQWRKATELAPGSYRAWSDLGAVLQSLGDYAGAERAKRKALQLHEHPDLLQNMGTLLSEEGRDAEAVPYYERAAALNPGEYIIWFNLGDADRRLQRRSAARDAYQHGLSMAEPQLQQNPQNAFARAFAGYFFARLGQRSRALDEMAQALHAAPANSTVGRVAVLTYNALGLRQQALDSLTHATPEFLRDLEREPDLADFCRDPRFQQLVSKSATGGK
ncbi:MAG: protein kinase domain-containing protein [Candidatus Korobacteraceae bacterium]|jgi:tetratricopeptide (TPR) repeat protein